MNGWKLLCLVVALCLASIEANFDEILLMTVATERNDPLDRWERSAKINKFNYQILGLNETWTGGDVKNGLGGGQKVNILKKALLERDMTNSKLLVMFTDSYDVVINDDQETILNKYRLLGSGSSVVFGAEKFCWPEASRAEEYPVVTDEEYRFLNSGGFIGPIRSLMKLLTWKAIQDTDDDQKYFTEAFLDATVQSSLDIVLDTKASIFMNINGAMRDLSLNFQNGQGAYSNVITKSTPSVYHANGPVKTAFNSMANYLAKAWTPSDGCLACEENLIGKNDRASVQLSIFMPGATPFLERFFERILNLTYPGKNIDLLIYSPVTIHANETELFMKRASGQFRTVHAIDPEEFKSDISARLFALEACAGRACDYAFMVDGIAQLTDPDIVQKLIRANRSVIAPMLTRRQKLWSNFWGALSSEGYYSRSDDYIELVERVKKGIWNVPFLNAAYLVKAQFAPVLAQNMLKIMQMGDKFSDDNSDMLFCYALREANVFMWIDNRVEYGYLMNPDSMTVTHLHNDLWQTFDNPLDWQEMYIHPENREWTEPEKLLRDFSQPCPDVFWIPLMSEKFCKQMIEEMESFGEWSTGNNKDTRLEGGYENVPTRDIHMRQVDWEPHWLHVLRTYVKPIVRKLFQGHDDEPWARMNFIVRYRPDEQPSLRPHHDASAYTLNMALNRPGVDYEGGGAHFLRYNCTVRDTRIGWPLVHPGRVTHFHEGLPTTNGTRYIFVTFVNP